MTYKDVNFLSLKKMQILLIEKNHESANEFIFDIKKFTKEYKDTSKFKVQTQCTKVGE